MGSGKFGDHQKQPAFASWGMILEKPMGFFGKDNKVAKILSIEDYAEMQDMLKFGIQAMGYEFLAASDGMEGVKLAEKEQPDIILLDINMPGISGTETCLLLKKNPKTASIPVFMCTSESSMRIVEKAINYGADGYINKPVNMDYLKQKLAKELAKKAAGGADAK
jgi:CheY-like chemotaxis protein